MEKKYNNVLKVMVGLLFLAVVFLLGYVVYNKVIDKGINNVTDNEIDKIESENNITIDDETKNIAVNLYNRVTGLPGCVPSPRGDNMVDYYIDGKISNNVILKVAYMNALEELENNYSEYIDGRQVEKYIEEIFGKNTNYEMKNLTNHTEIDEVEYKNGSYNVITGCGGDPGESEEILTMIYNIKKDDNKIYVTEKMIYVEYRFDEQGNPGYNIYSDYQKTKKIASMIEDFDKENYINQASTYLYTFTLENDSYYFTNFQKLN